METIVAITRLISAENKNFTAPERLDWNNSSTFVSGDGDNRKRLTIVLEQICNEMNVPDVEYMVFHHHTERVNKSRSNGFSFTFEHAVILARNNDQFSVRVTHI